MRNDAVAFCGLYGQVSCTCMRIETGKRNGDILFVWKYIGIFARGTRHCAELEAR